MLIPLCPTCHADPLLEVRLKNQQAMIDVLLVEVTELRQKCATHTKECKEFFWDGVDAGQTFEKDTQK